MASFNEIVEAATSDKVTAGDECPEDECSDSVTHWDHTMKARFGTRPNPEAPENELVCPTHGIVDSYNN